MALLAAFLWLLFMLCSFIGWGSAALSLCARSVDDWASSGAVGVGLVVAIGGFLNMAGLIKPVVLFVVLGLGVMLFLLFVLRMFSLPKAGVRSGLVQKMKSPLLIVLFLLLTFFIGFRVYGSLRSVSSGAYNAHDDREGYLVFPQKMLASGSLAADPYSERRIVSNLGGGAFLSTLPLLINKDPRNTSMVDQGIGFLFLLLATAGMLRSLRIEEPLSLFFLLCVSLTSIDPGNTTTDLLGVAILMACVLLMGRAPFSRATPIVLGLTIGALSTCKSTFFAGVGGLYFCFIVLTLFECKDFWHILRAHATTAFVAVLTVAPWAFEMKRTCGTWLYPFLGRGFHASAYGLVPALNHNVGPRLLVAKFLVVEIPLCVAFVATVLRKKKNDPMTHALASAVGGGALSVAMIAYATGGSELRRYIMPFAIVAIWAVFLHFLRPNENGLGDGHFGTRQAFVVALLALTTGALIVPSIRAFVGRVRYTRSNVPLVSSDEHKDAVAAQDAVPVGATVLINLKNNFDFDFKRNTILIADWPGSAGPPPGPPFGKGPESLAAYLMNNGVHYLAYDYSASTGEKVCCKDVMRKSEPSYFWVQVECKAMYEVQSDFWSLGSTRKRIFDDGRIFVLDLARPVSSQSAN